MAAFLIVDLDIHDADGFSEYRSRMPEFIAKYSGKYLVRGGDLEVIEGDRTGWFSLDLPIGERFGISSLILSTRSWPTSHAVDGAA
jgi:hypothetical protein